MAEPKTNRNKGSVEDFLNSVPEEMKKTDAFMIHQLMEKVTGEKGELWGASVVGYGSRPYKYANGSEREWMEVGFAPRKQSLVLYVLTGSPKQPEILSRLGKYKTGKSCLYINRLSNVDMDVLEELIRNSVERIRAKK